MKNNGTPYQGLAYIYDRLLTGVDYEEWADYVLELSQSHGLDPSSVLDLACGTGNSTLPWVKRGFSPVTGVDYSPTMIRLARQKARELQLPASFYCQDMRFFHLDVSYDLCVIYQDGLNYLTSIEDIIKTLERIKKHLSPKGLFIFDLNMIDKLPVSPKPQLGYVDEEEMTLVWESCYHEQAHIWEIELTAFLKGEDNFYRKFKEKHRERNYRTGEIISIFDRLSWDILGFYEAFTQKTPSANCRHVFFVVRPGGN